MAILFVGGVMNVLWIAAITIFVLVEKVVTTSSIISRIAGAGLIAGGVWTLATALR
jgi:predicted metal-binding membrane protein